MRFGLVGPGYWAQGTHAVALAREPVVDFAGVWGREISAGLQSLPRNSESRIDAPHVLTNRSRPASMRR